MEEVSAVYAFLPRLKSGLMVTTPLASSCILQRITSSAGVEALGKADDDLFLFSVKRFSLARTSFLYKFVREQWRKYKVLPKFL